MIIDQYMQYGTACIFKMRTSLTDLFICFQDNNKVLLTSLVLFVSDPDRSSWRRPRLFSRRLTNILPRHSLHHFSHQGGVVQQTLLQRQYFRTRLAGGKTQKIFYGSSRMCPKIIILPSSPLTSRPPTCSSPRTAGRDS